MNPSDILKRGPNRHDRDHRDQGQLQNRDQGRDRNRRDHVRASYRSRSRSRGCSPDREHERDRGLSRSRDDIVRVRCLPRFRELSRVRGRSPDRDCNRSFLDRPGDRGGLKGGFICHFMWIPEGIMIKLDRSTVINRTVADVKKVIIRASTEVCVVDVNMFEIYEQGDPLLLTLANNAVFTQELLATTGELECDPFILHLVTSLGTNLNGSALVEWKQCFTAEFRSTPGFNPVVDFWEHIQACIQHYRRNRNVHGPFFSMIQSSGYGKTRLTLECASEGIVIYMCFRGDQTSGYPPYSGILRNMVVDILGTNSALWAKWMQAIMYVVEQMIAEGLLEDTREGRKAFSLKLAIDVKFQEEFWISVMFLMRMTLQVTRMKQTLVLVFDEAMNLTPPKADRTPQQDQWLLNYARKALQAPTCERNNWNVCGVFLDTDPSIANLVPQEFFEAMTSSSRSSRAFHFETGSEKYSFLPPYYTFPMIPFLQTTNSYEVEYQVVTDQCSFAIKIKHYPMLIALQSRPLFASLVYNMMRNDNIDVWKVVHFARTKLCNIASRNPDVLTNETALFAIAAVRWHLRTTSVVQRSRLVEHHMATATSIPHDGTQSIEAGYPSEPMLVEASMHFMENDSDFNAVLSTVLKNTVNCDMGMSGSKGEIEELIASIIFTRAYDCAAATYLKRTNFWDKAQYSRSIPLLQFLGILYSNTSKFQCLKTFLCTHYKSLATAMVSFTHFVKVEGKVVSEEYLKQCLLRHVAIVCQIGEAGIDIIIPLALALGDTTIDFLKEDSFTASAFHIQVKNVEKSIHVSSLLPKIVLSSPCAELMGLSPSVDLPQADHDSITINGARILRHNVLVMVINVASHAATDLNSDICGFFRFKGADYEQWKLDKSKGKQKKSSSTCSGQPNSTASTSQVDDSLPSSSQIKLMNLVEYDRMHSANVSEEFHELIVLTACGLGMEHSSTTNLFPMEFLNKGAKKILLEMRSFHRHGNLEDSYINFRGKSMEEVEHIKELLNPCVYP